jgi:hypothetical protein
MHRKLALVLIPGLLLAGCAGPGSKAGRGSDASRYPAWVLNPDKPGYVSVVASAPKQDFGGNQAQYRVALIKARQELAQMIRVQVESTSHARIEERNGKATHSYEQEDRLRSQASMRLDQAQVLEEWTDPKTGDLYIWLVTPK